MRGSDQRTGEMFSYVELEARVRADHPLRSIRAIVNAALAALGGELAPLYARVGRPSIPPEKLLRAMLLQAFYSIRSERQLMERLDYDLLFRWFVGLGVDDPAMPTAPAPSRWARTRVVTQRTSLTSCDPGVTPHAAQNTIGRRSAIDCRTTRHAGYGASQKIRKRIKEAFGWIKRVAG